MPPAFNLSQDQTLQFNLAIFCQSLRTNRSHSKRIYFHIFDKCEVLLLCLESISSCLSKFDLPQVQVPTLIGCFFYLLKNFFLLFSLPQQRRGAHYIEQITFVNLFLHTLKSFSVWLRGQDLNLRPSGYEPDELPDCSTPRQGRGRTVQKLNHNVNQKAAIKLNESQAEPKLKYALYA